MTSTEIVLLIVTLFFGTVAWVSLYFWRISLERWKAALEREEHLERLLEDARR